jgi:hypothetical protein
MAYFVIKWKGRVQLGLELFDLVTSGIRILAKNQ